MKHVAVVDPPTILNAPQPGAETLPISMGAFISAILAFMMGGPRAWDSGVS